MKKSELKTGMIVTLRNGESSVVLLGTENGDILGGAGDSDSYWGILKDFNDNLISRNNSVYDIVSAHGIYSNFRGGGKTKGSLLWERDKEIPEYTMEELQKKLGEEFKIKK